MSILSGMDEENGSMVVHAEVPIGEMFGYATDLRSATQGRASYSMEFARYTEAPANITQAVIKKVKGE